MEHVHVSIDERNRQVAGFSVDTQARYRHNPHNTQPGNSYDPPANEQEAGDLVEEERRRREGYVRYNVALYLAAMNGDWKKAMAIFKEYPELVCSPITEDKDRALHIAAAAKQTYFVKKLAMMTPPKELEAKNNLGNTALHLAASSGSVQSARVMVQRNNSLPNIKDNRRRVALSKAVSYGHRAMARFLLEVTDMSQLGDDTDELLINSIDANFYEVVKSILDLYPNKATTHDSKGDTPLQALSRSRPSTTPESPESMPRKLMQCLCLLCSFLCLNQDPKQQSGYPEVVYTVCNEILKDETLVSYLRSKAWAPLIVAAQVGNVEFLALLIHSYPELIRKMDENLRHDLFENLIKNRHGRILKLLHDLGYTEDLVGSYKDDDGNNILHRVAKQPLWHRLNQASGAALQMQQELLWLQAIQKMLPIEYAITQNVENETPEMVFVREHEDLRKRGEEWMKKTAESCSLVAALVSTVIFAAAFTLPGGNDSHGVPILAKHTSFVVFFVSNAASLISSSSSLLVFLSILTSRYAVHDFRKSLPLKLMSGLALLFLSIATMMIAFTATFFMTFRDGRMKWVPIPIALLAAVPIAAFSLQHIPLLMDLHFSTYRSKVL